jgi:deoxyribonuclease-4
MTHLGSYAGGSKEEGLKKVKEGLVKVLKGYHGKCALLLELSAGCGNIIGSRFEEIHKLLTALKHFKLAVCLDTAHIFASGYDLRTKEAIDKTLEMFDSTIGFSYLQLIHLNDSLTKLCSKKDRHANIGDGEIGVKGCELLLNHPYLKNINFILETPGEENRRFKDIEMLKRLRK